MTAESTWISVEDPSALRDPTTGRPAKTALFGGEIFDIIEIKRNAVKVRKHEALPN